MRCVCSLGPRAAEMRSLSWDTGHRTRLQFKSDVYSTSDHVSLDSSHDRDDGATA